MRGTLSKVAVPYASKRPIRYLPRLKASQEYRWALDEWRTGTPISEQWKKEQPPKAPGCERPADCAM
jgi:hypothetical protein